MATQPEKLRVEAMQNDMDAELEFWKGVAAMRERSERNETLH
jgi:hypothetical protein